ncbi:hypothetical protein AB0M54_11215 [Actinoplanes sp. NPDC051470]|uniref:hypothetical protein n=1 Tax=unclassified Actinoplanes TaxID=2626549 RepID=UPI003418613F
MKRIGSALLWLAGVYFVARAVVEPFTIDFGDPSTYLHDWGGPGLIGVLFVHCGLGVVAAALMAWRLMRSSSLRLQADRSAPPPDGDADRPHRVLSMAGVGAGLPGQQERGGEGDQDHQERHA